MIFGPEDTQMLPKAEGNIFEGLNPSQQLFYILHYRCKYNFK